MEINAKRLVENIKTLGRIGYEPEKGTTRPAYSKAYFEGEAYVADLMEASGLSVRKYTVGNLIGTWQSTNPDSKILSLGSHIDTVPNGGIYDGTLGVLAAVECVRTLREQGYRPKHTIQIIAFEDEEGNVVGGTFGSKAFTGNKIDEAMLAGMQEQGITMEDVRNAAQNKDDYLCYLELHIEQGGLLEAEQKDIGVASGIVAILRYKVRMAGKANHAGSTPMRLRDDALEKACLSITDLLERVRRESDTMVGTVGTMEIHPGAVNVIPGEVNFIVELRDMDRRTMYGLVDRWAAAWKDRGLTLSPYIDQEETRCDLRLLEIVRGAADSLGLKRMEMHSGAGHDLINMGKFTPSALIFIPSRDGISHSIDEYSSPKAIADGANILLETLLRVDRLDELIGKTDL